MILSKVSFPKTGEIKNIAENIGYVARGATVQGKRIQDVRIEVHSKHEFQPHDFGYIAGYAPSVHINSGLEHCTQIALFDIENQVGASSHFQVVNFSGEHAKKIPTLEDLKIDLMDMRETLEILGAKRENLLGACIFGMGEYYPARAQDVLRTMNFLGLPVNFVYPCKDANEVFRAYLGTGLLSRIPADHGDSRTIKHLTPELCDLSSPVLEAIEQAQIYFNEICGNEGREEYENCFLPRFIALNAKRPNTFLKKLKKMIDIASYESSHKMVRFFKFHLLPEV